MREELTDDLGTGLAIFIEVHVIGAIQPEDAVRRRTGSPVDLGLNIMLEIPVKWVVLWKSPKIGSCHGCYRMSSMATCHRYQWLGVRYRASEEYFKLGCESQYGVAGASVFV